MDNEVFKALSGGLGLASKLMGKGVDEVSKVLIKPEEYQQELIPSSLYFSRGAWSEVGTAFLSYLEPQTPSRLSLSLLKNFTLSSGEKEFVYGLNALFHGDYSDAQAHLEEATKKPESKIQITDAYFVLGSLQLQLNQPHEAAKNFKTGLLVQQGLGKQVRKWAPSLHLAIPLTPSSRFCIGPDLVGLTTLLAYAQSFTIMEEAVDTLEQLLQLVENDALALFFVSLFRSQTGDYRSIFQSLQKLLPDSNLHVATIIFLGKACHRLGDPATARDIFKKALQYDGIDQALRLDLRMALSQTLMAEGNVSEANKERTLVQQEDQKYRGWEERLYRKVSEIVAPEPSSGAHLGTGSPSSASAWREETPVEPAKPAPRPIPAEPVHLIDATGKIASLVCAARNLTVPLQKKTFVIGREEGEVVLDGDGAASRQHARISYLDGEYWVEDLNSTNGTWVNRHRIRQKVELSRGDILQVGESTFVVS